MHQAHKIRPADMMNPDLVSEWALIAAAVAMAGVLVALLWVLL